MDLDLVLVFLRLLDKNGLFLGWILDLGIYFGQEKEIKKKLTDTGFLLLVFSNRILNKKYFGFQDIWFFNFGFFKDLDLD